MAQRKKTYCRNCPAQCGIDLEIDGNTILRVRGDRSNPISKGYFCIKGEASKDVHNGVGRLRRSLEKTSDGFRPIPTDEAIESVAARLRQLVDKHGSRSVGLYIGTATYGSSLTIPFAKSWMDALGSPQVYSTTTIDQSPKIITALRMGTFASGRQHFQSANVWLISGSNPLVSHWGNVGGLTPYLPGSDIREARKRGLKLIVIDPRKTETARSADIHLQPLPGRDVALHAAILNHILSNNLHDAEFCARYVQNLDELRDKVSAYDLETAAHFAGVPVTDLRAAAELFAQGPRGCATSGTGTNMAPYANLAEHLLECLNVVCGRYRRAGDVVLNPSILLPGPVTEGVIPPFPIWDVSPKMSSHPEVGWACPGEFPCNLLADEILHEGEDRLRALIVLGGNPAIAIPDYYAVQRALRSLELLVTLDIQETETTRISDYVISCKAPYERADISMMTDGSSPSAAIQYSPAVLHSENDAMEDWEVFYTLARKMGLEMEWGFSKFGLMGPSKMKLDMQSTPSVDELLSFLCIHPAVTYTLLKERGSMVLDLPEERVQPCDAANTARLQVMPAEVADEFDACLADGQRKSPNADDLLLHSRRLLEALNSNYVDSVNTRARRPVNPLYMNPQDMEERKLADGVEVEVCSDHGVLRTIVRADATERRGAVSMHHSWARRFTPDGREEPALPISVLIDKDTCREQRNFVPRMSAIPVRVRAL